MSGFQPVDFPGAALLHGEDHYLLRLDGELRFLTCAPVGDGPLGCRWVLSQQVDVNDRLPDPTGHLERRARDLGVPQGDPFIGLLTAVDHRELSVRTSREEGVTVTVLATVGTSNATSPVERSAGSPDPPCGGGTINLVVLVDADLGPGALVRASTMAAESKVMALMERGVRTPRGNPATGTSTDVTAVGHTGHGRAFQYAGGATLVGWLVGDAVYHAVRGGLDAG